MKTRCLAALLSGNNLWMCLFMFAVCGDYNLLSLIMHRHRVLCPLLHFGFRFFFFMSGFIETALMYLAVKTRFDSLFH